MAVHSLHPVFSVLAIGPARADQRKLADWSMCGPTPVSVRWRGHGMDASARARGERPKMGCEGGDRRELHRRRCCGAAKLLPLPPGTA